MQEHSHFEELCAAASVGQISEDELRELRAHTTSCDSCRELQAEFIEINSVWLMQGQKLEPDVYDPQSVLRKNILRKLESAKAQFSAPLREQIVERPERISKFSFPSLHLPAPAWAAALVVVGCGIGFGIGVWNHSSSSVKLATTAAAPTASDGTLQKPTREPQEQQQNRTSDSELLAVQHAEADLQEKLAASSAEKSQLQSQLKKTQQSLVALQEAGKQDAKAMAQLQTTADQRQAALVSAQTQLQTMKDAQASKDAELAATLYRLHEVEGAQEHEHQLAALSKSSELRDVIASRNLHIIDVADVDRGGVRRPFGRVFYTEGKSLIFYAYDLSNTKGKQTFYAWGHREGDPNSTRVLGALSNDDEAQKRWVFKFNDAKVLAQIDSVYVTLEPNSSPTGQPKGKRLLYAYLGTPANHP